MTYKEFVAAAEAIGVGNSCTCTIEGDIIDDAKLQFEYGRWFICQNIKSGTDCDNKLGYAHSWVVAGIGESEEIPYLRPAYVSEDNLIPYEQH